MKKISLFLILVLYHFYNYAQVGIGTTNPNSSSILDITSTNSGVLLPRLTNSQESAIVSPETGLVIFNTDRKEFRFNYGTAAIPNWISTSRNISVKYSNNAADTSVNVNANTAINAPIISTLEWNDDTTLYSVNTATNTITVNQTGRYRISVNVSLSTAINTDRLAPEMWIEVNGTQRGTFASTGYIRTNNAHDESSLHITEVLQLNANDVVSLAIVRTGNAGVVNLRTAGSSNIYIEKI
ncbi:hypothetical protein [Siansivirga zeaxanthinifaciens]|uniref:C1q domain-containing protein n=1 Tax=Siansivirga zeaxanthinifaciens CC-SAMT-1 TaxID=1454006 RepID=A0A0C5WBK6_9FLAO|nr:hypothetical protein [Siansivirga zeaxanthinifaciens]AJR03672.1 hypothetical protein AW14_08580 [Siansivirga zeaxanthinifaciens CC-SAMT-1]